jgi:hypothetical protein
VRLQEGRVDGERYDLYFESRKVGTVTLTDSDFPNLWGVLACEPWVLAPRSPEEQRFSRFVELNKESTRLLYAEDEVDNSREQAVVDAELAAGYMDLVESDDWRLVDRGGRELPILCPILRRDGEIVWRWNPHSK